MSFLVEESGQHNNNKTYHDVGVSIQEFHELFQAPEATFATTYEEFGHFVFFPLQFVIDVLQNYSN